MADLLDLLEKTSRTFALSIPRLPEPTRTEVTIAYLLFRIADTFEDAVLWPREKQIRALEDYCRLLNRPRRGETRRLARQWARDVPVEHDGYVELLREVPFVLESFFGLSSGGRELVREHTLRTARGMADIVARTGDDGILRLRDLEDLRNYCYVVAGIVGEMLTELFLLDRRSLAGAGAFLRERSATFGEGLQLVNILKDSATDAREGRVYLPPAVGRGEVLELAYRDLDEAAAYTLALQDAGAEDGLVAFNALPVLLAWATLEKVEREGPGAKISRERVWAIVDEMERALEEGRPVVAPPSARQPSI